MERERHEEPKPVQKGDHEERVIRTTPEEEQLKALGVFLLEKRDEAVILKREEETLPCSVLYPP